MDELTDTNYEADAVLGTWIAQLREHLGNANSFDRRVRLTDHYLQHWAGHARQLDGIYVAANEIASRAGVVSIGSLARNTGLSLRQFERRFLDQIGVRPKLHARIARFQAALHSKVRSSAKTWTGVALQFGYVDQMHMIHDFREFAGESPQSILLHTGAVLRQHAEALGTLHNPEGSKQGSGLIL